MERRKIDVWGFSGARDKPTPNLFINTKEAAFLIFVFVLFEFHSIQAL